MGIIEDINKMQSEGRSEQDITNVLQGQGHSIAEIYDAFGQARIKEAVTAPLAAEQTTAAQESYSASKGMQPSLLAQQNLPQESSPSYQPAAPSPAQAAEYAPYAEPSYQAYPDYNNYAAPSADTIAEIAEQIVAEKMVNVRRDMEKILDFRTMLDTKIEYLDERLKRIEKIIDRLQISILQKVGDYITNVEDIKQELVETQKSFKTLSSESKRLPESQSQ